MAIVKVLQPCHMIKVIYLVILIIYKISVPVDVHMHCDILIVIFSAL